MRCRVTLDKGLKCKKSRILQREFLSAQKSDDVHKYQPHGVGNEAELRFRRRDAAFYGDISRRTILNSTLMVP